MSTFINPWDMGSELGSTSDSVRIPNFALAKFMVVRMAPPKTKTIRDGLVMTAVMVSYIDHKGEEVKTVTVNEGTGGYDISFPLGKRGMMATKYRGPKSMYKFINPETNKFYQISNDKFTTSYATQFLKQSIQDWDNLSEGEKDMQIDEYFENMYTFGMANDFALDTSKKGFTPPKPGMVTQFYRRYTPPVDGEKYGNTIITKWPSKKDPEEAALKALTGDYKMFDEAVAVAIFDKLQEREDAKFDTTSFDVDEDE